MSESLLWLVLAALLGVAEVFTLTLVLGLFAGGALLTALVAALGAPLWAQVVTFVGTSAFLVLMVRPIALRHRVGIGAERMNADAVVGSSGKVLVEISDASGLVKLRGEDWTARPWLEGMSIPPGSRVEVVRLEGATVYVSPLELASAPPRELES